MWGGVGGEGTPVLWCGGSPHAGGCSGRGTPEWSKHWTSAFQYFLLEASPNDLLLHTCHVDGNNAPDTLMQEDLEFVEHAYRSDHVSHPHSTRFIGITQKRRFLL